MKDDGLKDLKMVDVTQHQLLICAILVNYWVGCVSHLCAQIYVGF